MEYYPTNIIRYGHPHYFIWAGNDDEQPDQFLMLDHLALSFQTIEELAVFTKSQGITINFARVINLNLDVIADWRVNSDNFPADEILTAWNIFLDFSQLGSPAWQIFRALSDEAREVHYTLSRKVISSSLYKTGKVNADNLDLKTLHRLIQSGVRAFDIELGKLIELDESL